ncbi:MAG: glycosyltransferase [Alloprevotella sp.]|nr:glycosyltransferase [Alloprevotella sp.]
MKGLLIWADSYCRSTLAFFDGIGKSFGVPCRIIVIESSFDIRTKTGFSESEFKGLDIIFYSEIKDIDAFLQQYQGYYHIFGVYQKNNGCRDLIKKVLMRGDRYGIASEAPNNLSNGFRRFLKCIYHRCVLPIILWKVIKGADFIINLSGDLNGPLLKIGWKKRQIIPCGYYSPALPNTNAVKRDINSWKNFSILLTGIHAFHRSPMVLMNALHVLDMRGIKYTCHITQNGPLLPKMKQFAEENKMEHVRFEGFLPLEDLNRLYSTCSVYVGAGANEAWGIRLNDALNCGAPLVVSTGMGGVKLVRDYQCGLAFPRKDYKALADCLERLIKNKEEYLMYAEKAVEAASLIDPYNKASEIANYIKSHYSHWN